ncbi:hypothetical protein ACRAWF_47200 [Streptomyces sp. L7]
MIGPNSLGLFNAATQLRLAWGHFTPGTLAIVSQSGQLGSEIAGLGARAGLGVSRFYSVGKPARRRSRRRTRTARRRPTHHHGGPLSGELLADGARIVAALAALRRAGKHAFVLTTGASEGSRRLAARSHTGSMTSALDVVDAACRATGASGWRHRANSSTLQGCWTRPHHRTDIGSRSSATAAGRAGSPPTSPPTGVSARRSSPTGCRPTCVL